MEDSPDPGVRDRLALRFRRALPPRGTTRLDRRGVTLLFVGSALVLAAAAVFFGRASAVPTVLVVLAVLYVLAMVALRYDAARRG